MIACLSVFPITLVSMADTRRQVAERSYTRQKEVSAASDRSESWQALNLLSNWPLGDGHVKGAVLRTEDRIALVPQFVKAWVVRPHIHRKFKLSDEARAADESGDTSLYPIVGHALW
jgi:hypothetical protein